MGYCVRLTGVLVAVAAIGFGLFFQFCVKEDPDWHTDLIITGTPIRIKRNRGVGTTEMWGKDNTAYAKGLGKSLMMTI